MAELERIRETLLAALADKDRGPSMAERLCVTCLALLAVDGLAVSLASGPEVRQVVCASDELAARVQSLQRSLGEGPSLDAFATGAPVLVADISAVEATSRWPVFGPQAAGRGAGALFVFPLRIGGTPIGVLDCHRLAPGPLSSEELAVARRVADAVAVALLAGYPDGVEDGHGPPWEGWPAGRNEVEVYQATGMIAAQLGLGTSDALARLRAAAFAAARSVDEVAADVVARRIRFRPEV